MKFGSLFAGIGGFDLGLERAGFECAWQVEINDYANRVLEKHWTHVTRHRDVRECGVHNLNPVDLICGGFPCQDISYAGKGEGLEGKRSGLWKEFYRIICEIRPKYVLVENVAALRSRGLAVVLSDLAAIGYDSEWHCIPASAIGAPHQRDRIWIIAYTDCPRCERQRSSQSEEWDSKTFSSWGSTSLANPNNEGLEGWNSQILSECIPQQSAWEGGSPPPVSEFDGEVEIERDICGVAHGISKRVDRLRCLGNAVVPQIVEWIGRQIKECA